jgi:threonine dehydratase
MTSLPVTPDHVRRAHELVRSRIRRTPTLPIEPVFGHRAVSLKLELLQHAGSFKTRGAFHTLLSQPAPPKLVAAASGGNHGVAVAYAARVLGLPARIFVPAIASAAKVAAIRAHGAEIVVGGERYADAQAACDRFAGESGALVVHPYDTVPTISGAGTVALEWDEDAKLDTVLVGCGGGGLAAGMAAFWSGRVRVVAVEPEGSRALHAALEAGEPVDVPVESVAADSLGARSAGRIAFEIAKRHVDHVALVTDDAIRGAQRALWRELRVAAEPGGAAALGALLSGAYRPALDERVGVLVCGGNVDLDKLADVVATSAAQT